MGWERLLGFSRHTRSGSRCSNKPALSKVRRASHLFQQDHIRVFLFKVAVLQQLGSFDLTATRVNRQLEHIIGKADHRGRGL